MSSSFGRLAASISRVTSVEAGRRAQLHAEQLWLLADADPQVSSARRYNVAIRIISQGLSPLSRSR